MISSQKIIMMIILINVMIGFAIKFTESPDTFTLSKMDDFTSQQNTIESEKDNFVSEEGLWGSVKAKASQVYETTIGNVLQWGGAIIGILIQGFNPWSISTSQYTNIIEQTIVVIIGTIRTMMTALLMFEIYLIFKNKKST